MTFKVKVTRQMEFVTEVEADDLKAAIELARLEANKHSAVIDEHLEVEESFT